jgi:hypothetical protein
MCAFRSGRVTSCGLPAASSGSALSVGPAIIRRGERDREGGSAHA